MPEWAQWKAAQPKKTWHFRFGRALDQLWATVKCGRQPDYFDTSNEQAIGWLSFAFVHNSRRAQMHSPLDLKFSMEKKRSEHRNPNSASIEYILFTISSDIFCVGQQHATQSMQLFTWNGKQATAVATTDMRLHLINCRQISRLITAILSFADLILKQEWHMGPPQMVSFRIRRQHITTFQYYH